jgi:hypothetical protein
MMIELKVFNQLIELLTHPFCQKLGLKCINWGEGTGQF